MLWACVYTYLNLNATSFYQLSLLFIRPSALGCFCSMSKLKEKTHTFLKKLQQVDGQVMKVHRIAIIYS